MVLPRIGITEVGTLQGHAASMHVQLLVELAVRHGTIHAKGVVNLDCSRPSGWVHVAEPAPLGIVLEWAKYAGGFLDLMRDAELAQPLQPIAASHHAVDQRELCAEPPAVSESFANSNGSAGLIKRNPVDLNDVNFFQDSLAGLQAKQFAPDERSMTSTLYSLVHCRRTMPALPPSTAAV